MAAEVPPRVVLQQMVHGYRVTQMLSVAAKLGIADRLEGGPQSANELAKATGAQPDALYRLLRTLASIGVFEEIEPRRFALTPLADLLRTAHPTSFHTMALYQGDDAYHAWGDLLYSVMTGAPAFDRVFGAPHFAYMAQHPEVSAPFDQAMSENSRRVAAAVVAAYDFADAGTVVDVGGGQGALLAAILGAHPGLHGILFDQPHVVASAQPVLAAAGVADRCEALSGDFFAAVPPGGDSYVLRHILHDWDDERSVAILRTCAQAMPPRSKVLVVEAIVASGNEGSQTKFLDLQMLVMNGGRERTAAEYERLFASAGLRLTRIIPTASDANIIEGERATE
jgi:hypothetical protein